VEEIASVAQSVEQLFRKQQVSGSNPDAGFLVFFENQMITPLSFDTCDSFISIII
jgi:hypothetical protein